MNLCPRCSADLTANPAQVSANGMQICTGCGAVLSQADTASQSVSATASKGFESSSNWIRDFFSKTKEITLKPKDYFSRNGAFLAKEGGLSSALAFAVLIQWAAAFFNFFWRALTGSYMQQRFSGFFQMQSSEGVNEIWQKASEFLFGAGTVLLTPFLTLAQILFTGMLIHAAARFFIREPSDRPLRYTTTVKVLALANAPWILCFIPGLGVLLAWVLSLTAAVAGIREVYRTTNSRAVIAVLFPEILFLSFILVVVLSILFLALGTLRLLF